MSIQNDKEVLVVHDKFEFDGRVAVITRAGRGIGRETALAFASSGARADLLQRGTQDRDTKLCEGMRRLHPEQVAEAIVVPLLTGVHSERRDVQRRWLSRDLLRPEYMNPDISAETLAGHIERTRDMFGAVMLPSARQEVDLHSND